MPGNTGVDIGTSYPLAQNFPTLASLFSYLFPKIMLIAAIVFFVIVVIAGLGIIMGAGGDDAHANESKKQILTYGLIGLMIIFGAFWVLQIINFVTGGSLNSLF